ncbi:MAG TPA: agmatinase [Desulfotomaculum sp.]|nr:agmatinase [Desulfotomaculum sp.]
MLDGSYRAAAFLGANNDYAAARVILIGAGLDATVCFRAGTREGPRAVRYFSHCLEEYSMRLDRDLREAAFCDLGDLSLPFGGVETALSHIGQAAGRVLSDGKIPVFLGGEHLITLPVVTAVHSRYPDLVVLHLDAHADLRDEYLGAAFSHATVIRRVAELLGGRRVYQFGIRSADERELEFAGVNTRLYPYTVIEPLTAVYNEILASPVYVTLDIDVVDPAYAPGVGTPEPGGIGSAELMEAVYALKGLNLVGFDLVEVNPVYDPGGLAPLLAAKVIREVVLILSAR